MILVRRCFGFQNATSSLEAGVPDLPKGSQSQEYILGAPITFLLGYVPLKLCVLQQHPSLVLMDSALQG
jgi:hypothetical protein